MKYAFIGRHRRMWPVSVQCRVLQVSVAGYHEHLVRRASSAQRRHLSDEALLVHIKAIHAQTRGAFRDVLKEYGITSSMSRRGNRWDNACSETLFGSSGRPTHELGYGIRNPGARSL